MTLDSPKTLAASARAFFSGTLISRATGLGREVAMAAAFGTMPQVAAFWMAFRFAHLLRRLFGEGALHAAFVPHFETLRKEDPQKGALFFHRLSMRLTTLLLALTIVLEVTLAFFSHNEVVRLTMTLLPALIFISLYALNTSLLNCERTYFLPSLAPAVVNLIWIAAVILLWNKPPTEAMERLAMIIVFAFAAQWFVTVPTIYRYLSEGLGEKWWQTEEKVKLLPLLRPFALGILGVAATQLNSALDALFARAATAEGPAYLWYALRLQQLPLALIGVGFMGALLPPLSRALQSGDQALARSLFSTTVRRTLLYMIPITAATLILAPLAVKLIYGHGNFTTESAFHTTRCLRAYALGLLPMSLVLIFATHYFGRKDYKTPTLITLTCVGLNIGLNTLFVFGWGWGAVSVAIATSISATVNATLLGWRLRSRI